MQVDLNTNLMKTRTKICRVLLIQTHARARAREGGDDLGYIYVFLH